MADKIRITVCVVALTQNDYQDLEPAIQAKLTALSALYDFSTAGAPYAASPDDWQPFGAGLLTISKYLEEANLAASFLSARLYDSKIDPKVLKNTNLYIIDPFVLTHTKKRDRLAREIQTAIFVGEKAFCIILPEELPKPLRVELANLCASQLCDLYSIRKNNDSYEWKVEDSERLQDYLNSLARQLSLKPDLGQLAAVKAFFSGRGVPDPNLSGPPPMVT